MDLCCKLACNADAAHGCRLQLTRGNHTRITRNKQADDALPALPPAARYLFHSKSCNDWGLAGWALSDGGASGIDRSRYSYFIFASSSVRGPFLPAYIRPYMHWSEPLLRWGVSVALSEA